MSLIIHAPNIHVGGGKVLLLSLLSSIDTPAVLQLDKRLKPIPKLPKDIKIIWVAPRFIARLKAEKRLQSLCSHGDVLLCFGNLPPLFHTYARVFVYLQNRYLTSPCSTSQFSFPVRLRIFIERLWLRYFIRNAYLLVQTKTMAQEVFKYLGCKTKIIPFLPNWSNLKTHRHVIKYDYLYVASGEPHKNHKRLLEAWVLLAQLGFRPSLYLTLDKKQDNEICAFIKKLVIEHNLQIINAPYLPEHIFSLYKQSKAFIYPSLFESYGLPLMEAAYAKLPIIAAERDYVYDVVTPIVSFDPESSLSIARAVLRHQGHEYDKVLPVDPSSFLKELSKLN